MQRTTPLVQRSAGLPRLLLSGILLHIRGLPAASWLVSKVDRPVGTLYRFSRQLARLHDLWIVLAWAGLLTGIMLNTFYHRGCSSFTQGDPGDPCLSFIDLIFIFVVAVGAGLSMADERIAIIGFVISLAIAVVFFILALAVAPFLGLHDPIIQDRFLNQS